MPKSKKDTNISSKKKLNNAKEKKAKTRGRKSKYETHVKPNLDRIPKWRRNGMTEEQICKKLGVGKSAFNNYKAIYPELVEVLKNSNEELIENLEDSLFKRAMGYQYEETKIEREGGVVVRTVINIKELPPDVGALIFALKNLAPNKWRNDDRVILEDNREERDMHRTTLAALKNRKVAGFNDDDEVQEEAKKE